METVSQIILCVIGTLAFAITMNAPKSSMKFIFIGSLITAGAERTISLKYNDLIACMSATMILFIFCEITAKVIKEPKTIILLPSMIPLLPGSSIYYTMLYIIQGNRALIIFYLKATLLSGLGIALGTIVASATITLLKKIAKSKQM